MFSFAISWKSTKQTTMALSTADAQFSCFTRSNMATAAYELLDRENHPENDNI